MQSDLETITRRLYDMSLGSPPCDKDIARFLDGQRTDGAWPDIDYASQNLRDWYPFEHVKRMLAVAQAYRHPKSSLPGVPRLKEATLKAFDAWVQLGLICPNWWFNVIGVPNLLYRVMLLMEDVISSGQRQAGIKILKNAQLGMTGQNLVWVAEITVARGCLERDPVILQNAFGRLTKEITVSISEGIQPDFSFHQHGRQLYNGGYGRGFATDCARLAALAGGTAFQLPRPAIEALSGYLLDGQQWMIRGYNFDHSVCGREIARMNSGSATALAESCRRLAPLDAQRRAELEAFAARLEWKPGAGAFTGNKHFWCSDYMAHRRPAYSASVHMTSTRTIRTEICIGENRLGRLLCDGVNFIYRTGAEYQDIFPAWNWRRLPGITCEYSDEPPSPKSAQRGERSFVGGVSDGLFGMAAMDFARDRLAARKAWFFFDDEFVCLGAGISRPGDVPVITAVNQCLRKGAALFSRDGAENCIERGEQRFEGPAWVHHDGVGYVFPERGQMVLKCGVETGSWQRINLEQSADEIKQEVFSLWLEHGSNPANGGYAYIVTPGRSADTMREYAAKPPLELLMNTRDLQAVWRRDLKMAAAAFWRPGKIALPGERKFLAVDKPCLVLMRKVAEGFRIAVSNPENAGGIVQVEAGEKLSGEDCFPADDGGSTRIIFRLPGGPDAGKSLVRVLQML